MYRDVTEREPTHELRQNCTSQRLREYPLSRLTFIQ